MDEEKRLPHNMRAALFFFILHVPIPNILFYIEISFHFADRIAFIYRFLQYIKLVEWYKAKSSYVTLSVNMSSNLTLNT